MVLVPSPIVGEELHSSIYAECAVICINTSTHVYSHSLDSIKADTTGRVINYTHTNAARSCIVCVCTNIYIQK